MMRKPSKPIKAYRFKISTVCIQSINMYVNIGIPFRVHQLHTLIRPKKEETRNLLKAEQIAKWTDNSFYYHQKTVTIKHQS